MNSAGTFSIDSPSTSATWLEKMMSAMPLVKPVTTGEGMYLMMVPELCKPGEDQHHAGHERRDNKPVIAMLRDDVEHDNDEGARGPSDLEAAPAQRRDRGTRPQWP